MNIAVVVVFCGVAAICLYAFCWMKERNQKRQPTVHYLNYATDSHKILQEINTRFARDWGAQHLNSLTPDDLEPDFVKRNRKILESPRGGGFWIWKPHIIRKTLEKTKNDKDVLVVYCDSASFINLKPGELSAMLTEGKDIGAVQIEDQIEKKWVKGDLRSELQPSQVDLDSPQIAATFICARNNEFTRAFFAEWERLAQIPQLVTDTPSIAPNDPEFREHRHDQAIFSLLCKKHMDRVRLIPLKELRHHCFG